MTLWRSLRPRGRAALPLGLLLLSILPACFPSTSRTAAGGTATASPKAKQAVRTVVPVHVGKVHLEGAAPIATATPAPVRTAAQPTVTPHPVATPTYAFAPPKALPKILAINLSQVEISGGETVSGTVDTTSNVASVEARIAGWSMSVPRTRIGHFEASGQLPDIPFFLKGNYTLQVIARNAAGEQAERDIPITVR